MRKLLTLVAGAVGIAALAGVLMRYTRLGTGLMNDVVNPFLVRRGLAGGGRSELGTLEHVGRRTGTRHLSPVHPVATSEGFQIVVPLGERSEWARNVLAAGHCRMQLHDTVYELDEPVLLAASEMGGVAGPAAWVLDRLGWEYLVLRRFAVHPGHLELAEPMALIVEPGVPVDPAPLAPVAN